MVGPKSMRGRELKRVFFLFGVRPVGMREEESFLSLLVFLRECEEKMRGSLAFF